MLWNFNRSPLWQMILCLSLFGTTFSTITAQSGETANEACADNASIGDAFTPGLIEGTLNSGGVEREYRLYIPESYRPDTPAPLIFTLHGFASSAVQHQTYSNWELIAEANGLLIVYPQGTGFPARWYVGDNALSELLGAERVDDVAFFRGLVTHISQMVCVDAARIYANGISNGGGMAYQLACEAADVFAAVGGVADAYFPLADGCTPSRPVPFILFHGTADRIVPFEGTDGLPNVEQFADDWAEQNGCTQMGRFVFVDEDPVSSEEITGSEWTACNGDADVILYVIEDGGHTWPGGDITLEFLVGRTAQAIDASALIGSFFAEHPMPSVSE